MPEILRYWDGRQWTGHTQPTAGAAPIPNTGSEPSRVSFFGAKKRVDELQRENHELRSLVDRLGAMDMMQVEAKTRLLATELDHLRAEKTALGLNIQLARAELVETQGLAELQDVGLYQYRHPAESSVALRDELERVQGQIKDYARAKAAILADTNFTFNNSTAKGRKFVNDMSRIMLRAYNAEAENCVKTVKAGNLPAAQARLRKAMEQIQKQGTMIALRVAEPYHQLRLRELELAADFQMRLQKEKDKEREERAALREQRKAEQELKAERGRLEKERKHYANAILKLESNGDEAGAHRLRVKLADVERAIQHVDYRSANIRAGYVYVISNIGAFGEKMVKIGMTRRLEPIERVRELGDASVPFRFDVHALFFADDAVSVETRLHQAFEAKRVNKVNLRREFFYATPEEVLGVLKSTVGEVVEYAATPEAEEYRLSNRSPESMF